MKLYNWFFLICILSFSALQSNDLNKLKASLVSCENKLVDLSKQLSNIGTEQPPRTLAELNVSTKVMHGYSLTHLDISDKGIAKLPSDLGNYITVKRLNLSNNKLTTLDDQIGKLVRLEHLDLSNNAITSFPSSFKNLIYLSGFNLDSNGITDDSLRSIVGHIKDFKLLTTLTLSNNKITRIPDEISCLKGLESLVLENNKIADFSLNNVNLNKLKYINLKKNLLSTLPNEISQLDKLKAIDLSDNKFEKFPEELNVAQFNTIYLSNNKIKTFPDKFFTTKLNNLTLDLTSNPLTIDDVEKLRILTAKPGVKVLGLPEAPVMVEKKAFITWLKTNKATSVGKKISLEDLPEFWELDLSGKNLTELHSGIKYAVKLRELYLSRNNIKTLPPAIKELKELEKIVMFQNPNQDSAQIIDITGFKGDGTGRYTK